MTSNKSVKVKHFSISNDAPFTLIAGPCALESRSHALEMSSALVEIANKLEINLIYKTSFDKANRTSADSSRGLGLSNSLPIFAEISEVTGCATLTDVHLPDQCQLIADVVDVLQIPAFLCRQTDLIIAAAETGKPINIKKGQFLAPWDMQNVLRKAEATGNKNLMVCERGTSFGYNTLISDMRSIPILASAGYPLVFDATHSVQQPGGQGTKSGGQREFVPVLARAAVAIGIAAVFIETHGDPDSAFSDGPNMVPLKDLYPMLETFIEFDRIAKRNPIHL
tara:strand:- start:275 stop:1117 length:843 start_codon:yes stop_codon:yes gene_type:complete